MMGAQDTVMRDEDIDKLCSDNKLNLVPIEIIARKIAQAQAEISFKAGYDLGFDNAIEKDSKPWCDGYQNGIKEVVEFVEENGYLMGDKWQAKLKSWRIE